MNVPTLIRRCVLAALVLLPLVLIGVQTLYEPGRDQASVPVADRAAQVSRGAYLARAGNCMACHTAAGGRAYAGGRAIQTPFGSIYTSNLTPDRESGIGNWSADDFWRALHNGKSRDGRFLYPAFPYPNYTKVTRIDADALYAYLMTLTPVRQENQANTLAFPFNQRVLLAFWRTLYFTPGEYAAEPSRSAQWNRGAYLVQGLGHCGACHTGRDALGGSLARHDLGGASIPGSGWYAAALGQADDGELARLLKTGVSMRGAVFGPMAEVVSASLQHLSDADTEAMAAYLGTVARSTPAAQDSGVRVTGDTAVMLRQGAALYRRHCAECHQDKGQGQPGAYPALAGNRAMSTAAAVNPVRMVLNGGFPPSTAGNPRPYGMPPFGHALNDQEVAAVVSFLRTSWGNAGTLVSPVDVARLRGVPLD